MSREYGLSEEYKNNGMSGVLKRLTYYVPNHYVINKVKNAPLKYGLNQTEIRKIKVVVSMTSYPPRFNNIYLCLKSLLLQTYKPDRIIVYLGNDTLEENLTEGMRSLQKFGIEYRFDKEKNLRSHKKYIYAMKEFPDDIIITVDDDSVYPKNTIESLIRNYRKHPSAVSARRVHKITFEPNGKIKPYSSWRKEYRKEHEESSSLIAVGVGGVLYPPHCLDERAFDEEKIADLCMGADDIWLKCMELLRGTKVVWTPCFFAHPPALSITSSLWQGNVNGEQNNLYLSQVMDKYKIKINE